MDKEVEQKYNQFQDSYNKSQISKDIDIYSVNKKIENMNSYKEIEDVNTGNFIIFLSLYELIKDSGHIFHAKNIYNWFKDLSNIHDNNLKKHKIKMIKDTITMFFR